MSQFLSFSIGDAGIMALIAVMWWRLGAVEAKVDKMVPKDVSDAEHEGLQKQINGIHRRLDVEH